jgi:hypothetical protein
MDLDDIEPVPALIAVMTMLIMVYSMFGWNPEYWGVVPVYLRIIVAVASPFVAYLVAVKVAG